ncbi:MAG: pirin family protein [Chitinophagaceae bacterium]
MKHRSITKYTRLERFNVGPFQVKQPLPATGLDQVDPFLLIHHAGPSVHKPGEIKARLSPHPHRGFEPVTFLFSGKLHHKDSTGSEGFLETGDVQWMTSGSGIIHSEGPSEVFAEEGGTMELIQLWVNLPRNHKMTKPKYQDIKKDQIPVINRNGFEIKLVAGEYNDLNGPASTFTPMLAMMINFEEGAETNIEISTAHNALVYVLNGTIESNGTTLETLNLGVSKKDGDVIELKSKKAGKLLLLAGEPIKEPIASHGPFVMNYPGEIRQAMLDYQTGKMGVLDF